VLFLPRCSSRGIFLSSHFSGSLHASTAAGEVLTTYANSLSYNAAGQLSCAALQMLAQTGLDLGNDLHTAWGYQNGVAGLPLVSIDTGGGVQALTYSYQNGYLATASDGAPAPWGFDLSYDYDELGRLESVSGSGELPHGLSLDYTAVGNLETRNDLSYDYDVWNALPHAPGGVTGGEVPLSLFYDANGNRERMEADEVTTDYTYNPENRLTEVTVSAGDVVTQTHYLYDGDGARVLRVGGDGGVTLYVGSHFEMRNPRYYIGTLGDPDFAIADDGARYVVGIAGDVVQLHRWDGLQWVEPITLSHLSDYTALQPRVAVDGDDVHVVWIAEEVSTGDEYIFYSHSNDGGVTWSDEIQTLAYNLTGEIYDVAIGAGGGQTYVAWTSRHVFDDDSNRLNYCQVSAGDCQSRYELIQREQGFYHNHPELAVSSSGAAHLVWWAADVLPGALLGDEDWARVHYRQLTVGEENLTLTDTLRLSSGDGFGDDAAQYPRITVDGSGRVHIVWYQNGNPYRYCDGGSDCNNPDNWSVEESRPVGGLRPKLDLVAGRDGSGTPVIHLLGDKWYTKRTINCASNCWLTPTISVSPLAGFDNFKSVHLATGRDGRPQVVVGAAPSGDLYYLDLTQGSTSYYYVNGQAVAERTTDLLQEESHVYYLHHDHLGNLTEVTNENKGIVGRARYDAFGRILENSIPPTVTLRLYTGSIYDPDTGLYKIGARWYDPLIGVWLTPDAVVPDVNNPLAWNGYAFNYNNPVNYVDPSGHFPWLALGIGFALGGGFSWLRGYGPDTWQFYASAAVGGLNAGIGAATGGAFAFFADVGLGTLADTTIFGDQPGGALASNLGANLAFAAIGRGLRYLSPSPPQFSEHLEAGLRVLDEYEPGFAQLVREGTIPIKEAPPVPGGAGISLADRILIAPDPKYPGSTAVALYEEIYHTFQGPMKGFDAEFVAKLNVAEWVKRNKIEINRLGPYSLDIFGYEKRGIRGLKDAIWGGYNNAYLLGTTPPGMLYGRLDLYQYLRH
jgi:RHS repeat-associated protein